MDKKKAIKIFAWITGIAIVGYGAYAVWDYLRVQKLNASVVTPDQALSIIQQGLNS
jgi:hypothetical protein